LLIAALLVLLGLATVGGGAVIIPTAPFVLVTEHLVDTDTRLKVSPTVQVTHPLGKGILIYFTPFVNRRVFCLLESQKTQFHVNISA
jgi:hypothetical protein